MADNKTEQSMRRWERARERVEKAKSELVSAECELANAANDLGRWLSPDDAAVGEKFSVWVEGKMLVVEKNEHNNFKAEWRKTRVKTASEKPNELAKAADR